MRYEMRFKRSVFCVVTALTALLSTGCRQKESEAADYASFRPQDDEIGFEIYNIDSVGVKVIRDSLNAIKGIEAGSIRIRPEGNLVILSVVEQDATVSIQRMADAKLRAVGCEVSASRYKRRMNNGPPILFEHRPTNAPPRRP